MEAVITGNSFSLGEVKFDIDPTNLLKSLEALEKQTVPTILALSKAAGLPVEPFERRLVRPVLMGVVQNAWYAAQGGIPEKCAVNQAGRVARYLAQIEELKNNDGKDLVVTRKKPSGLAASAKPANLYRLTAEGAAKQLAGQKYVIQQTMLALGATVGGKGVTVRQVVDNIKTFPGIITPAEKNITFHMNGFGHESVIERVEADGTVAAVQKPNANEEPAKKPVPAPAAPAAKAPAAPAKKGASKK